MTSDDRRGPAGSLQTYYPIILKPQEIKKKQIHFLNCSIIDLLFFLNKGNPSVFGFICWSTDHKAEREGFNSFWTVRKTFLSFALKRKLQASFCPAVMFNAQGFRGARYAASGCFLFRWGWAIKTDERFIDRTKCIEISRRTSNTSYCNADFPGKVIAGFPEQVKDNSSSFILVLRTQSSINCPAKPNCLLP